MELNAIIEEMQGCIFSLQQRVEELKGMDDKSAETILLTRQEAADLLGKSLRQLDRDCRRYGIRKVAANGGVRIPKIDRSYTWGWCHVLLSSSVANWSVFYANTDGNELSCGDTALLRLA